MSDITEHLDIEGVIGWDLIKLQKGTISRKNVLDSLMKFINDIKKSRDEENKKLREQINILKIDCNSRGKRLVSLGEDDVIFYAADFLKDGD